MKNLTITPIKESLIQQAILQYLRYMQGVYCIRNNSFSGKLSRRDGSEGWINNAKKGAPDLIICYKGLWIGLEIKTSTGKQSHEQKEAEQEIIRAGGRYFIVRSVDDVIRALANV